MRNSSLVECVRAPTIHRGSSSAPKLWLLTTLSLLRLAFFLHLSSLFPSNPRVSWELGREKRGKTHEEERAHKVRGVGERSRGQRSPTGRTGGGKGSENAGMSSALHVEIMHTVSLRVPKQGLSSSGQSGLRRS